MPARVKRGLWLSLVLVAATACSAPRTAPPAPVPATPATARAADLLAGTSGDYPPLSRWTGERPEGYAPALLEAFAARDRVDVRWTRFRWPELSADLRGGRFVVAADGITVLPDRSVAGCFTVPIAWGGAVLLVRRPAWAGAAPPAGSDPLATVATLDRAGLRVVVNRGGHLERVAHELFRAADVRAIADNAGVRDAFARGDADAAMTNTFEAPRWAEGVANVERVGPLGADVTALWVSADRPELAERLDAWLLDEEASGRLGALRVRWLGDGAGEPTARPVEALLAATKERLALMPFVAAAKRATGKRVEDVAQERRVIAAGEQAVARAASARGAPAPRTEAIDALYRAEIEAAKWVEEHADPATPARWSLERELRPAIARVSARIAFLVVRVPGGLAASDVAPLSRKLLADSGLDPAHVDAIAAAIAPLGAR